MKIVRLGIIGCGVVGQKLLQGAMGDPGIEITAVADVREQSALDTAARFKASKTYTSATSLIADSQIDAVVLALPTAGRVDIAIMALREGKHVLVEKPVGMNASEVRAMIEARGDRTVGCCSARYRALQHAGAVAKFIATGTLGDLRLLQARSVFPAYERPDSPPPAWRLRKSLNGGGILMNAGCYDLDYLLGLTGWRLKPRLVLAQTWTVPLPFESHVASGSDAETHVVALIRCEGGTVINLERAEYTTTSQEEAWRIIGTRGSLRLQMTPLDEHKIIFDEADSEKGVVSRVLWEGKEDWMGPHAGIIRDFAAAIREGRDPLTTLEQALLVQQTCDAIYASAERGTAVSI